MANINTNSRLNVTFVEPKPPFFNVYSSFKLPLLGSIYMATMLKGKHNVSVLNEKITKVADADLANADVLVLTAISSTAPRAYDIAKRYKEVRPLGRLLIGGPHVSAMPQEAASFDFIDHVGVGEGDKIIEGLVEGDFRDKVVQGTPLQNLDDLPFPDYSLVRGMKTHIRPIETSRGCPHHCEFCSVTEMYGRKMRYKSIERVIEELRRNDKPVVFFTDDNFLANKARSVDMLTQMISQGLTPLWLAQGRPETGTDMELTDLMNRANCHTVCVGYESVSPQKLKAMGKGKTVPFAESLNGYLRSGVRVHGMFILDDVTDYKLLKEAGLPYLQITVKTPAPGTAFFKRVVENNGFIGAVNPIDPSNPEAWRNWQYFDGGHVVTKDPYDNGKELSQSELADVQKRFVREMRDFYPISRVLERNKATGKRGMRHVVMSLAFWYVALRAEIAQMPYENLLRRQA